MINFSTKYNRTEFVRFLQNDFLPEADFLPEVNEGENLQTTKYTKTITKLGVCPSLRLAVYELEYEKEEVPVGVAINEAVELAKCFGSEESGAFVNGILGKIANPDKKVAARKASSKKEEQTSARPKSGFKVKDPSKKVVVVNRNVSSRAPENKNE